MFESVIGHENEKQMLKFDIENDKVSHAYLFSGIDGIGKKTLAIEFAKEVLKTNNLNTCVDYTFIEKLPDKKEIIVDQIRDKVVNTVYISPATCDRKVYIINDAELLNIAAQNALLKTLEEPPKYVTIILITNNERALLTTVFSRVKKINFNKLSDMEIEAEVKARLNLDLSKEMLGYANGSLKIALDMLEEETNNKYLNIQKLYRYLIKNEKLNANRFIEEIDFKDEETFKYLEYLLYLDKKYSKIHIVEEARRRMKQNANEDIVKQVFVIKITK